MKYNELLKEYKISEVTSNSKKIRNGTAFVAIKGEKFDGNNFIEEAINAGVSLIFTERKDIVEKYKNIIPVFYTPNARKSLAEIASAIAAEVPTTLIAVTGTNGKTSTVHYIAQMLSSMGHKTATIGTLGINLYHNPNYIEFIENTGLTTADSVQFNKQLEKLKKEGVDNCVIEASSIGLDQYRLYGRKFKVAGFTSFSRDHIDYHKSMETYLDAKLLLFDEYLEDGAIAVINSEISEYKTIESFLKQIKRPFISVGRDGEFKLNFNSGKADGQEFSIAYKGDQYSVNTKILGGFQAENIAISIAMLESIGYDIQQILSSIKFLTSPPGRLERVADEGYGSSIFIDYAHTPDALENVLKELQKIAKLKGSKVFAVFGCGGDRDKGKRKLMGEVASKYADIIIITDDNPRSENPEAIRKEILEGASGAIEIAGRREAIKYAIDNMGNNDIVLLAGKGHEDYQIIAGVSYKFSDKEVAREFCDKKSY